MDVIEKKEIVREDNHDYASKGVAGTALGLGIAGTALALLNGNGLFGWGKARNEDMYLERKECQDYVDLTKEFYAGRIQSIRDSADVFYNMEAKLNDSAFRLYKSQRDNYDVLADRIAKLETKASITDAVEPWRDQVLQMKINSVAGLVDLEAQKRSCSDNILVNYMNSTFYPKSIADVTVGTTTTKEQVYNPLKQCGCGNTVIF